jgi:integrase
MSNGPDRVRVGENVSMTPRGKKGIWVAEFWRDNRHCRRSLKTTNKKVASQRALQPAAELADGTYRTPPPTVTIRQAADDYLAYLETECRAQKTLVKYTGVFAVFVEFLAGPGVTRLAQITAAHFDRFRAERKRAGRHVKTMYTEGVIVKQMFRWTKTRRLILENPLADIKLNKPRLEPRGGPAFADVDRILAALSEPDRAMVAVLAFTGMRSGELQRLNPDDVDLKGNWIHIVSRVGAETKTRRSRKLPIHPRLRLLVSCTRGNALPMALYRPGDVGIRRQRPAGQRQEAERAIPGDAKASWPSGRTRWRRLYAPLAPTLLRDVYRQQPHPATRRGRVARPLVRQVDGGQLLQAD